MSHLSTLVERVWRMENQCAEDDPAFQGRLLNIVEYMTYNDDWTDEEAILARKALEKHKFDVQMTHQAIETKHAQMRGLPDMYHETCVRCGRHLSNKYSIQKGMGPVCRSKANKGDWGKDDHPPELGRIKMEQTTQTTPAVGGRIITEEEGK